MKQNVVIIKQNSNMKSLMKWMKEVATVVQKLIAVTVIAAIILVTKSAELITLTMTMSYCNLNNKIVYKTNISSSK